MVNIIEYNRKTKIPKKCLYNIFTFVSIVRINYRTRNKRRDNRDFCRLCQNLYN